MARPWVTPDNVKEYSDLEDVLNRSEKKLKYDIQRAEAYIISFTNNSFSDDDYPGGVPEDVKLADVILAEYFAHNKQNIGKKTSETFDDYLLCEYMHDMGNSMGGLGTYMKLIDKYEMYHGGFIWDFIDQALLVKDEVTGKEVLRYGGDFDDKPSDYEFSGNGIVFADRKEKPAMQEVRYYYGLYR